MKKIIILFVLSFNMQAQIMWQVKENTSQKWYYQFGDEFNAYTIDENKWKFGMPWGNVLMQQDLSYSRNNVVLTNGYASFIAKKENLSVPIYEWEVKKDYLEKTGKKVVDGKYDINYTAGMISSKRKFKYGYFEIRFKANEEKGIWPAFWLFGGEPNEEIDIFELKGEREKQIHLDVHCPKGCDDFKGGFLNLKKNWGAWVKADRSLGNGWNIISGEWQANYVKFFLNGNPIGYFEGEFKTAQNLLINTCVAKDGEPFNPGPSENTKWPNNFDVDYVRVWSTSDTADENRDNYIPYEHTYQTITENNLYDATPASKAKFIYNKKALSTELGTITLLPILYNKYSLSVQGTELKNLQVDVIDRFDKKVAGFALKDIKYYILDLGTLPTGPYKIKITVAGQILEHELPIINPEKVGEQEK